VDEIRTGEPFVGLSGKELTRMLHDAGIIRAACRITNVTMERPDGNDISTSSDKNPSNDCGKISCRSVVYSCHYLRA